MCTNIVSIPEWSTVRKLLSDRIVASQVGQVLIASRFRKLAHDAFCTLPRYRVLNKTKPNTRAVSISMAHVAVSGPEIEPGITLPPPPRFPAVFKAIWQLDSLGTSLRTSEGDTQ